MYIISKSSEIRVWRSLVARLTGGQEAAGSSPVTRTRKNPRSKERGFFIQSEGLICNCRQAYVISEAVCNHLGVCLSSD